MGKEIVQFQMDMEQQEEDMEKQIVQLQLDMGQQKVDMGKQIFQLQMDMEQQKEEIVQLQMGCGTAERQKSSTRRKVISLSEVGKRGASCYDRLTHRRISNSYSSAC